MQRNHVGRAANALLALGAVLTCLLASCARSTASEEARCGELQRLTLDHVQLTSAKATPASRGFSFTRALIGAPFLAQPASCRVTGVIRPAPGSEIGFEVWLPSRTWNGRLQAIGNGGFAGSIDRLSLSIALHRDFAVSATDTGHVAKDTDGAWALNRRERVIDYGYRAIHETALVSKALVKAYFGKPAAYAYFGSASNGGREGLMEAQRFPDDYDGILAGAPALDPSDSLEGWAGNQKLMLQPRNWLSPAKLRAVSEAVLRGCDAQDGVKDGVIESPLACRVDMNALLCRGPETSHCLTPPQAASLAQIYNGPAFGGRPWGFAPGGEMGWKVWITGSAPGKALERTFTRDFLRYLVYGDATWDVDRFDPARDRPALKRVLAPVMDAVSPDLRAFQARGGKLILYHGWSDPALQPQSVLDYVAAVRSSMGEAATDAFMRLYMVPGLEHVFGGPGANAFGQMPAGGTGDPRSDINAALEAWVEKGIAPNAIVAGRYDSDLKPLVSATSSKPKRTRLLCPFPQVARWTGGASSDQAINFTCALDPSLASWPLKTLAVTKISKSP